MYYGDDTLKGLVDHARSLRDSFEDYQERITNKKVIPTAANSFNELNSSCLFGFIIE